MEVYVLPVNLYEHVKMVLNLQVPKKTGNFLTS